METAQRFSLSNPATHKPLADELKNFIKDNKLFQNIQGKEYVNVEAWQYAGALLGLAPVTGKVENLSDSTEIKYRSRVDVIHILSGVKVSSGVAICSNKEQGRKYYQEYAICSMSETRAVGKAYRQLLAFLIRLAGYEATPAEEMTDIEPNAAKAPEQPKKAKKEPVKTEPEPQAASPLPELARSTAEDAIKLFANDKIEEALNLINQYAESDEFKPALKDAYKQAKARKDAKNSPKPPAPAEVVITGPAEGKDENGAVIKYATAKQKEEIIRALNNPVITRQEKTKMLLNINKLDETRAAESIKKLKKVIEDREAEQSAGA